MLRRLFGLLLACVLLGIFVSTLHAQQEENAKKLKELNQLTGNLPTLGEYTELLANKGSAKKLITYALEKVKAEPSSLDYNAAYVLAEVAKKLDQVKASESFYRICTKEAAKLESTRKLLQSYGGLIYLLYDNKDYKGAEKACRELLELQTGDGKPREVFVAITMGTGQPFFIKVDNYDSTRDLKPTFREVEIKAIAKQGRIDDALKRVGSLIASEDNWLNRDLKAWILYEAGKYQDAAQAYEDVLSRLVRDKELDPAARTKYEDRYRYILSNVYVNMGQSKKAIDQLKSLVARNPDDATFNNDLGYIMADNNIELKDAEKYIRKAIEIDRKKRKADPNLRPEEDKDSGAYLDSLGWVLYKQKKYKEAKDWLLKAVEDKDSQHIEIYDHLGDVYQALGQTKEALQAWRRGVEVATESPRDQQRKKLVLEKIQKNSTN